MPNGNWNSKGAALSDKTAIKEYGLTQEQIYEAVRKGELQYRQNYAHGNPYPLNQSQRFAGGLVRCFQIQSHGEFVVQPDRQCWQRLSCDQQIHPPSRCMASDSLI